MSSVFSAAVVSNAAHNVATEFGLLLHNKGELEYRPVLCSWSGSLKTNDVKAKMHVLIIQEVGTIKKVGF